MLARACVCTPSASLACAGVEVYNSAMFAPPILPAMFAPPMLPDCPLCDQTVPRVIGFKCDDCQLLWRSLRRLCVRRDMEALSTWLSEAAPMECKREILKAYYRHVKIDRCPPRTFRLQNFMPPHLTAWNAPPGAGVQAQCAGVQA